MVTTFGIDAQARLTRWDNIARSGARFAIFRCVGENGAIDPDYAGNVRDAEANGLVAGGYHFIAGGTSVEHCRRFVGAMGDPRGRLVVVDVERPNAHPAPTINDVRRWFDEYRKHHPHQPVVLYSGRWWWAGAQFGNPMGADLTPHLWSSRYVTGPYPGDDSPLWDSPYGGWRRWAIWQYRGSGLLADGSSAGGAVDLNAYRGTLDQLRLLTRPDTATGDTNVRIRITEWAVPRWFTIAAPARSFGAVEPFAELGTVSGVVQADAEVVIDQTGVPHGTFVRIITGPAGRRLVARSAGTLGEPTNRTVAGFAERLRAELPAFIDQQVEEYGA